MQNSFQTLLCLDKLKSKTLQTHNQYIFSQVIVAPCAVCDCHGKKVPISCCAVDCVVCVCDAGEAVCVCACADVHVTACSFPGYGVFRCACCDISVVNRPFVLFARSTTAFVSPLARLTHWLILSFQQHLLVLLSLSGTFCLSSSLSWGIANQPPPISPLSLLRAFAPTCKGASARMRGR